ncbi:type II/IV secretion system ATPase subunit [Methanolobus bombayensis]|uniref:type II/IV secretion system ATPase subunit n=1 Tax=Methanolobus bombayensis TaxID=38023 RepID=UPI001AE1853E|nr:type II/IV secretion system ATPase subunit [Methanolobus bombayensis]MBP1909989.1 flagellar protein FlaI [Methanolobus bombayensis]
MADAQSNTSEKESSTNDKNNHPEEVSDHQEADDEILNTDIRKEISEIEEDREKFEKDFAQLLSATENIADEDNEDSDDKEEEEIGILLPKSHTFGPPKPLATDMEKEPSDLISENDIIENEKPENEEEEASEDRDIEKDIDTDIEVPEKIEPEEELIPSEDHDIEKETSQKQEETEKEHEEKLGFVGKIKNLFKQTEVEIEPYDPEVHGPISEFKGVEGYEEVERYWVNEPYAFIVILYNEERNTHLYYIVEPELTDFEYTFLLEIKDRLRDVLLVEEIDEEADDKEAVLESKIRSIIKDYTIEITPPMLERISYYIKRDFVRFGKIDALMMDDSIEDVSGNGHDVPIFLYHRAHQNIATNVVYEEDELNSFIIQMAQRSGKHISVAEPMVDATMPDGSRIQMTLGTSVTAHGSTFTIRKFSDTPITPVDLIKWGTFSSESMAYLWLCIENNKSLIYAGGTASGKTSSLNAVSLFIPEKAKVISLEDTRELKLPHPNWIPSITRDSFTADERGAVDMYDLLKAALRQRPEFLLVGEVRGKEALTLFQAMSTGHTTFSTMHADSVASAIHRLENPPISVPRTMIQALDIMSIQSQTYTKGKRVRRNIKLVEIVDIDPNTRNIRTNDIFVWDSESDMFIRTGESKALFDIKMRRGWAQGKVDQELYYRQKILEHMVENGINDFQEISDIINAYQSTPEKVLRKLQLE